MIKKPPKIEMKDIVVDSHPECCKKKKPRIEGLVKIHQAWLLDVCEGNTEECLYAALLEAYNLGIVEGVRRAKG